ncbi:MAG: hypothetical protein WBM46_05880, partial [Polyangiales bacterium]
MGAVRIFSGIAGLSLVLTCFPACGDPGSSGPRGNGGAGGIGGTGANGGTGGTGLGGMGGGTGGAGGFVPSDCGDGERDAIEACDDGNTAGGDGCAADCMLVEDGYRCPTPGVLCIPIV